METIREVFSKPIDRRIEEVIKVDQADEETVLEELQEYVITESIGDHFNTVYKAIADANAMLRFAVRGELRFEAFHFRSEYEPARLCNATVSHIELLVKFAVLIFQVQKRDIH